jgi:hypothetical protein
MTFFWHFLAKDLVVDDPYDPAARGGGGPGG